MNLKDSYLHGTDQTALIRALKWDEGVLKYQSASTSTDWISIGKIPTWNQDTTGKAQYATYLTNGTNNLTYSNLLGISGKTISSGTANYVAYYSGTNTISAEQYLSTSRGGTGKGTWTQYGIVIGGVSNTLSQIAVPTWNANTTYWLKCSTNSLSFYCKTQHKNMYHERYSFIRSWEVSNYGCPKNLERKRRKC